HIKLPDGLRCLNITSTTKFFDYAINEVSNDVVITLENDVPTTITLGCKAAKLGQFTVYPMFIIADSGNAYHCTAACALQITDANVAPENTEGIPETQQPDQPDNTLDEQPSPVPTQPEPTPQV
ncbi:MAG: hypothetical protein IJN42_02970, partial [Clostridia bacterium]|nr:hypothetical protein [Clostridia bacterium]